MVHAGDVIRIYQLLTANNIPVWLTGGWGIDALLGKQTRDHKDLDMFLLLEDVTRARGLLGRHGYTLKELWSENRWVGDAHGGEIATAFVLRDANGCELDIHALRFDDIGHGIPAWDDTEGFIFTKQDLAGEGRVAGFAIPCISFDMQLKCHTGYQLPEKQMNDLKLLNKKFSKK